MPLWWYRNTLKSSEINKFELIKVYATNTESNNICNELRINRTRLMEYFKSKTVKIEDLEFVLQQYLSLLNGAIYPDLTPTTQVVQTNSLPPQKLEIDAGFSNKIRKTASFVWNNCICKKNENVCVDLAFDMASILFQAGLFYMSHARMLIGNGLEYNEENFTLSFRELKHAASLFKKSGDISSSFLVGTFNEDQNNKPSDLDTRIITGHYLQSIGEALEISALRAISKKLNPNMICDIYTRCYNCYTEACQILQSYSAKTTQQLIKWITFMNIKKEYFYSMAYLALSEQLLSENKCGHALRCNQESEKSIEILTKLIKQYDSVNNGKENQPSPKEFLPRIVQSVDSCAEKLKYENSLIHHQSIVSDLPKLPLNPYFGNIEEKEYKIKKCDLWTKKAYTGFSLNNL